MTVPTDKTYPAVATNAAWQKKKSFLDKAKAKTKTGLGASLTTAETKWKAIPWAQLDAKALAAKTVSGAQKNLAAAKLAQVKVQAAHDALVTAKNFATASSHNADLSKTAQAAATAIFSALDKADTRLKSVKLTDFEDALEKLEKSALITMSKVRVLKDNKEVATAGSGTWDRKLLKLTGVAWKVGKAEDYRGDKLAVRGETQGSDQYAEGISKVFANDMKIDSASGNTATFKPY